MDHNIHSHLLPFKRVRNFRDLGGYETTNGKRIVMGKLFRSGHLANLRGGDERLFKSLQIDTIINFQSESEIKESPDRIPSDLKIKHISLPLLEIDNNAFSQEIRQRILKKDFIGFEPDAIILEIYKRFPVDFSDVYRAFLKAIIAANGKPVLFHCTAGKDRTGFAAAILLRLLGVDMDTIMQDYLVSEKHSGFDQQLLFLIWIKSGKKAVDFIRSMSIVNKDWLFTSFAVIDEVWGSFENYIMSGLGLSKADISLLKEILLQQTSKLIVG